VKIYFENSDYVNAWNSYKKSLEIQKVVYGYHYDLEKGYQFSSFLQPKKMKFSADTKKSKYEQYAFQLERELKNTISEKKGKH